VISTANLFRSARARRRYFDQETKTLLLWPNSTVGGAGTSTDGTSSGTGTPPGDVVVPILRTLVRIDGGTSEGAEGGASEGVEGGASSSTVTGITFENVGFRDSVATYMAKEWSAPSGGDWSIFHGGAVVITAAANITITGCTFARLDGNAVYLPGR
jgi:hypothetical protein